MADLPVSADDLRRLARLVEKYDLSELRYEDGDLRVTLRTSRFVAPTGFFPLPPSPPAADSVAESVLVAPPDEAAAVAPALSVTGRRIEAPVMGVFYRSPGPGEPPFIDIGDIVEAGQPVGMIEAMKVFSEVLAESGGRVVAIPGPNGQLVQPGDPLVILEEE